MSNKSTLKAMIAAVAVCAVAGSGCGMMKGKRSRRGSSAKAYVGAVEFVNKSGQAVCSVELTTRDRKSKKKGYVRHTQRIEDGASATLTITGESRQLSVAACDNGGLLAYIGVKVKQPKLGFYADKAAAKAASGHQAVVANWKKTWDQQLSYWGRYTRIRGGIQDEAELAQKALAAVKAKATSDKRWVDTPVTALVAGKHGENGFPAYVGHKFPDGHCTVQAHWFKKDGDNVTYVRHYPMAGGCGTCAFLDWIKSQKGAASSAM